MSDIPYNDEYRAVIEDIHFRHHVIAKGNCHWTRQRLDEWLIDHPLQPLHTAYLLRVVTRHTGPPLPDVVLGQEVT